MILGKKNKNVKMDTTKQSNVQCTEIKYMKFYKQIKKLEPSKEGKKLV